MALDNAKRKNNTVNGLQHTSSEGPCYMTDDGCTYTRLHPLVKDILASVAPWSALKPVHVDPLETSETRWLLSLDLLAFSISILPSPMSDATRADALTRTHTHPHPQTTPPILTTAHHIIITAHNGNQHPCQFCPTRMRTQTGISQHLHMSYIQHEGIENKNRHVTSDPPPDGPFMIHRF